MGQQFALGQSRDHESTVLERLTQRLDGVAAELGELVEKQDPVVREASGMSPD